MDMQWSCPIKRVNCAKEIMSAFDCGQNKSKSCRRILKKFMAQVGHVTSNKWLDFRGDPDHDADTGIFKGIFPLRDICIAELYSEGEISGLAWCRFPVCF